VYFFEAGVRAEGRRIYMWSRLADPLFLTDLRWGWMMRMIFDFLPIFGENLYRGLGEKDITY
jgi:hypothetical protein